eukprot:m.8882 g.8882  ORF g.8882 m.8882 type:complete len:57 (-) comp5405_c0_seq1:490-660(-)
MILLICVFIACANVCVHLCSVQCIMYRTSLLDDVKRLDKFSAKLMRSLLQPEGASA